MLHLASYFSDSLYFYYNFDVNLDVAGTWHFHLLVNGQVVTEAPFTVISTGSIVNHPPGPIEAVFDPATPNFTSATFCRITSPALFLDPDYDFVRYHYVWKVNDKVVRDIVSAGLADAIPRDAGQAGDKVTCTVTPSDGLAAGPSATVSGATAGGLPLLNISTRLKVEAGDNVLIGGFIIGGTDSKEVIVRAIGPSLGSLGVEGVLADPTLELHEPDGTVVTNDNWIDSQQTDISASGLAPSSELESAVIVTLPPGAYTAIVSGKNGGAGIGLVEAYDLGQSASSQLANISTRGLVDRGDNVMIGGFIVGGSGSATVVVRAIGPSLGELGVAGPIQDPTLELYDNTGAIVATNDNWKDTQQAEIEAADLAPTDDRESAIEATLASGPYTAIVRGKNDGAGTGLVEVYNLP